MNRPSKSDMKVVGMVYGRYLYLLEMGYIKHDEGVGLSKTYDKMAVMACRKGLLESEEGRFGSPVYRVTDLGRELLGDVESSS